MEAEQLAELKTQLAELKTKELKLEASCAEEDENIEYVFALLEKLKNELKSEIAGLRAEFIETAKSGGALASSASATTASTAGFTEGLAALRTELLQLKEQVGGIADGRSVVQGTEVGGSLTFKLRDEVAEIKAQIEEMKNTVVEDEANIEFVHEELEKIKNESMNGGNQPQNDSKDPIQQPNLASIRNQISEMQANMKEMESFQEDQIGNIEYVYEELEVLKTSCARVAVTVGQWSEDAGGGNAEPSSGATTFAPAERGKGESEPKIAAADDGPQKTSSRKSMIPSIPKFFKKKEKKPAEPGPSMQQQLAAADRAAATTKK